MFMMVLLSSIPRYRTVGQAGVCTGATATVSSMIVRTVVFLQFILVALAILFYTFGQHIDRGRQLIAAGWSASFQIPV